MVKCHIFYQKAYRFILISILFYQGVSLSNLYSKQDEESFEVGNWIKNKEWQGRAEEVLADMDELYAQMEEYDAFHFKKIYVDIDKKLNLFYSNIGAPQESMTRLLEDAAKDWQELLSKSLAEIQSPDEARINAEQQAFEFERDMQKKKIELQQLIVDVQLVSDFDKALQSFQAKVEECLLVGQQKRNEAAAQVEMMKSLKSDQKNREKYYLVRGMHDQLNDLSVFFKGILSQETNNLLVRIEAHLQQVDKEIQGLESAGAIIKNRTTILEQLKVSELQKLKEEEERAAQAHESLKKIILPTKRKKSFFEKASYYWSMSSFIFNDLAQSFFETITYYLQDFGILSKPSNQPALKTDLLPKRESLDSEK